MSILARTPRLNLRQWTRADIEPYAELVADPEVMRYIGEGRPRSPSYAQDFVERMMRMQQDRGWMRLVVEHAETGAFMGFCGFDLNEGRLDFGWRYARAFWGSGYGFEAAAAAFALGREQYGLDRITSQSHPDNVGSVRIIEKLGMKPIGETEAFGQPVIIFGFPEEWPEGVDLHGKENARP